MKSVPLESGIGQALKDAGCCVDDGMVHLPTGCRIVGHEFTIRDAYMNALRNRSKDCPHVCRLLQNLRCHTDAETALVESVLTLSGIVQGQAESLKTMALNSSRPMTIGMP